MATEDDPLVEAAPSAAATLFDLRTVIAMLFGVFGILLTIIGIVNQDPQQLAKSGGIAINLWSGIVMIVLSAIFILWVRLRPPLTPVVRESGSEG